MQEIILEVRNLSFSYEDGKQALDDISLNICRGEKIAVLGSNGAGKSTFFLNLNGVREWSGGELILWGEQICRKNVNTLRKKVGIVFQDADSQIIASSVKAEIAFGPLNMKLPRLQVEEQVERAASRLKLLDYLERPPHYLSGGEKKRVTIADILAMDTDIIVFDEPTSSLDPVHAGMLEEILEELGQEGKTIMLSTHDVDLAYRFAQRVLVFHEGKLIGDGKAEAIFCNEELLRTANLKKPVIMQISELLKRKGILERSIQKEDFYPKTIADLEHILNS